MLRIVRNFVIAFIIAACVFIPAAYFVSDIVMDSVGPAFGIRDNSQVSKNILPDLSFLSAEEGNDQQTSRGPAVTALVVGTDYQPAILNDYAPTTFVEYPYFSNMSTPGAGGSLGDYTLHRSVNADELLIIKFDTNTRQFIFSYIPPETLVTCGGVEMTLSQTYYNLGIDYLVSKISSLTGMNINYYAVIDMKGVEVLVDQLEGVTVNVPVSMRYSDPAQNLVISLNPGTRKLGGSETMQLLRYNGYPANSQYSRATVSVSVLSAIAEKLQTETVISKIKSIMTLTEGYMTTTFSVSDLEEIIPYMTEMGSYKKVSLKFPGNYVTQSGRKVFVTDADSALNTYKKYR